MSANSVNVGTIERTKVQETKNTNERPLEKSTREIDLNNLAKKTFTSSALGLTNTFLSATVLLSKITGATVIPPLVLGHLTKSLHQWNMKLASHAFSPFKKWAETLGNENHSIIETNKVIRVVEGKLFFNPENYKKQSMFLIKAVFAPISLGLSIAAIPICIAAKPFWIVFFVPGFIVDGLATGYTGINYGISQLTYKPLQSLALKLFNLQQAAFQEGVNMMNNSGGF